MLTYAQKKYLFAIYRLGMNGPVISSSDVSRLVGVSKASTVKMTQRLSDEGYILKEPYGKISLTESGIKAASSLFTSSVILWRFPAQAGRDRPTGSRPGRCEDSCAGIREKR